MHCQPGHQDGKVCTAIDAVMGKYTVHWIFRNIYLQYKKHNYQTKNNINQRASTQKSSQLVRRSL